MNAKNLLLGNFCRADLGFLGSSSIDFFASNSVYFAEIG
jgi:hypothetical protein